MFPLFGLLILSFAVWGIGDIFRTGGHGQSVASVGNTLIDQRSFSQELSREVATMSQRFGTQLTPEQARAFGIPQQVLNRMISRALLDEAANELGLMITEEQMRTQILDNPSFQGATGNFDRNRFAQALQFSGMSEAQFLAILSGDTKREQLIQAVTEAAVAPESVTERLFAYREERRVADYIVIPNDSLGEPGEPDEAAIQETYENASDSFMTPDYKRITLVHLRVADAMAGIAVSDEVLQEEFDSRRDELSQPERRDVVQAVLPDEAAAQALAERLAEGADFAAAAEAATGRAPVALGFIPESALPAELGGPVFDLEPGRASAPIQSPLGWHVVVVNAIEAGQEAQFEDLRDQLSDEIARAQAIDLVIEQANRYDEAIAGGIAIEDAAANLGVESRRIEAIDNQGRDRDGNVIEALPALNEFLELLRTTALGDTSLLTETLDGDYFIVRVDDEIAATLRPLPEVRDDVIRLWQARERARMGQEKAESVAERLRSGEDFGAVAEAEGLQLLTTEPVTRFETDPARTPAPALSQQLFEIETGEIALVPTPGSQIVARLADIQGAAAEGQEARLQQLSDQLAGSIRDDIFQQFLASLEQDLDVTVNQRLIDEALAGAAY
ncbi:SurA N-terminal domain-containing protein [Pelagibius sp.]|uniref:SurA N-terminal domain-containing protein n=1 Tax=Pelagibius sp. TaxID=1931238 RepID=UPI003B5149CB